MAIDVSGLISRGHSDHDHKGAHYGEFGSLKEAMSAIGDLCDKGEDREVVCFYFTDGTGLAWTLTPNMR